MTKNGRGEASAFRQIKNKRTRVQLSLQNRDYNCTSSAITNELYAIPPPRFRKRKRVNKTEEVMLNEK